MPQLGEMKNDVQRGHMADRPCYESDERGVTPAIRQTNAGLVGLGITTVIVRVD
jgi:hypothetical protein